MKPQHNFHLVKPSAWPIIASFGALILVIGMISALHYDYFEGISEALEIISFYALIPGLLIVGITAFLWWADIVKEAHSGDHKPIVQLGLRYGVLLFILSEVMFFVAFFWSFFHTAIISILNDIAFPPVDIQPIDAWDLPLLNTVILLLSSATVTWAHHSIIENNRRGLIQGLTLTILLGLSFTAIQVYEYMHADFAFTSGIYASNFYMATGFHGAHVIIGTGFLTICLFRALAGHYKPEHHFGLEAAAWYWHFVDIVWISLFTFIYWWGGV